MPASKAQQKAVHKYTKENYDRFLVTMKPKGRLEAVKAHASARGESTNAFIGRAILETMERDASGGPQVDKIVVPVVCGTRDEWETAASIAKLPLSEFIVNAVEKAVDWAVSPELIEEVSLPSETIKVAQEAAQAAGEDLPQFVTRAIESRAALDKRKGGKQK